MSRSKILLLAAGLAGLLPAAAFACSADDLAGNWQCDGKSCVPGYDISRIYQASDGSWRMKDVFGNEARIDLNNDQIVAQFLDGPLAGQDAVNATLDSSCRRISWSATRQDRKL